MKFFFFFFFLVGVGDGRGRAVYFYSNYIMEHLVKLLIKVSAIVLAHRVGLAAVDEPSLASLLKYVDHNHCTSAWDEQQFSFFSP